VIGAQRLTIEPFYKFDRSSMISDGGPIHWDQARLISRQLLLRLRRKWAIYRPTGRRHRHYVTAMTSSLELLVMVLSGCTEFRV